MFNAIDIWLLKRYVPGAARLAPDDLLRLLGKWRAHVGWRRFVRLWVPAGILVIAIANSLMQMPGFVFLAEVVLLLAIGLFASVMEMYLKKVFMDLWFEEQYCLFCGYDLHGTIEAGRHECPECGNVVNLDAYSQRIDRFSS